MEHSATSRSGNDAALRDDATSSVVYGPLPVMGTTMPIPAALFMVMSVVIAMIVLNRVRGGAVGSSGGQIMAGAVMVAMFLTMAIGGILRERWQNQARRIELRSETTGGERAHHASVRVCEVLFALEQHRSFMVTGPGNRWPWSEFEGRLRTLGIARPRCVADSMLERRLRAIPTPATMLEPEMIATGNPASRRTALACIFIFGLCALLAVMGRQWLTLIFFLAGVGLFVMAFPRVRRLVPALSEQARAPVLGLGVIRDFKGRTWTVNGSIMLVTIKHSASAILVSFVGPAGWLRLFFMNETDPEFVKLWQRWNHPHPRPELLG